MTFENKGIWLRSQNQKHCEDLHGMLHTFLTYKLTNCGNKKRRDKQEFNHKCSLAICMLITRSSVRSMAVGQWWCLVHQRNTIFPLWQTPIAKVSYIESTSSIFSQSIDTTLSRFIMSDDLPGSLKNKCNLVFKCTFRGRFLLFRLQ
jgi:hypothetical protein